ncbi:hypothetical protein BDZ91DRAFT_513769 [Kalaharituber pfeilii]|nr:hypothetical protein BDZ91DRAFT_513769 [Kalaharituber pfeilii]
MPTCTCLRHCQNELLTSLHPPPQALSASGLLFFPQSDPAISSHVQDPRFTSYFVPPAASLYPCKRPPPKKKNKRLSSCLLGSVDSTALCAPFIPQHLLTLYGCPAMALANRQQAWLCDIKREKKEKKPIWLPSYLPSCFHILL